MNEDILSMYGSVVSWTPNDPWWVVVEDEDQVNLYRKVWERLNNQGVVLSWASLPGEAKQIDRLIVYFHANTHSGFRKADRLEHDLRCLVNLRSLEVPIRFAASLSPEQLPTSLQRLGFDSDGKTKGVLPSDQVFPGIQVLNANDCELWFEPQSFPDLRELTTKIDPKRSMVDVIATYPRLDWLDIQPIKETTTFERLEPCEVDRLSLTNGTLPTLDGIQRLRGLRCLKLKGLGKLTDISALAQCQALEILEIHWCPKLTDYEPLLRIPRLKSLFLFANKRLDKKACVAAFESRTEMRLRSW